MKKVYFKNIKLIFVLVVIVLTMILGGCSNTSTVRLDMDNYDRYIRFSGSSLKSNVGTTTPFARCTVNIYKKSDNLYINEVSTSYVFKLYDLNGNLLAQKRFEESSTDLSTLYKSFDLVFDYEPAPINTFISTKCEIQVLSISGSLTKTSNGNGTKSLLFILPVLFLLLFCIYPARAAAFTAKVEKLEIGTSYSRVVDILGKPHSEDTANGITTCVWKRLIIRHHKKTYILVFKDDKLCSKLN